MVWLSAHYARKYKNLFFRNIRNFFNWVILFHSILGVIRCFRLLQFRLLISKINNDKNLEEILNLRNLKTVDFPGDDNYFFHTVSHQLFGDIFSNI